MQSQSKTIDAPGLMMTYSPSKRYQGTDSDQTPHRLAEAAVRVLGACLLLYRQYVPDSQYYEVQQIY